MAMPSPDRLALMLSSLCFLGAFAEAAWRVMTAVYRNSWLHHLLMGLGFLGQCYVLGVRGKALGRCPITEPWELLVFISWGCVMLYWLIGPAYRLSLLGIFTAPMVWVFQITALILQGAIEKQPSAAALAGLKPDRWLEWHATMSLLAYASFALAAMAGVMFLVQERQLKSHHPTRLFFNLPPLHNLSRGLVLLLTVGLGLLTVGIATAYLMEKSPGILKLATSWTIWLLYLGILAFQWARGWPHRRLAEVSALAFLLPLVSLWVVSGR
jgi:ABC-type uncharacterized transport system permease subunit